MNLPRSSCSCGRSARKPGVNRVPEQQHSSDRATEERRLEAVRCKPWSAVLDLRLQFGV